MDVWPYGIRWFRLFKTDEVVSVQLHAHFSNISSLSTPFKLPKLLSTRQIIFNLQMLRLFLVGQFILLLTGAAELLGELLSANYQNEISENIKCKNGRNMYLELDNLKMVDNGIQSKLSEA